MSVSQPPVLKKVEKPTDQQSLEMLKSIDSRLDEMSTLKPEVALARKVEHRSDYGKTHKKIDKENTTIRKPKLEKEIAKVSEKASIKEKTQTVPFYKKIISSISEFNQKIADKMNGVIEQDEISRSEGNENLKEGITELSKSTIQGLLGPLNLVLSPLSETFGIKFEDLFKNDYKEKGKKIKPKRADVVKSNPEIAWAVDQLGEKNVKNKDEDTSLIDKLFGGALSGGIAGVAKQLFPALLKVAPFAAIAGGLVWAVLDGIKALGNAEKWGVDKVPAFLGGFFSGNGEGWKAVLGNAAKWGLVGLGVGMLIGGPIGAIAGALLGAALGGVFNWIGAENVSKTFNDIAIKLGLTEDKTQAGISQDELFKKRGQLASTYEKLWEEGKFDDTTFGQDSFRKTQKIKDVLNAKNYSSFTADAYGSNAMYLMDALNSIQNELNVLQYMPKESTAGKRELLEAKQQALIDSLGKLDIDEKTKKTNADFLFNELNRNFGYSFTPFEVQKQSGTVKKVNDAIITPNGRIITPSPDDTIIATKSRVSQGFDSDNMSAELGDLSRSFNENSRIGEVIDTIKDLISAVRDKPFNNVIQSNTNQSFDFDKLRTAIG